MTTATTTSTWRMLEIATPFRAAAMRESYEQAFLKAFDEYADALFRHASFRLSNRDRARDITQDTFIKAWDYARKGETVRHWKSLLYRILNNLIIDEYRRTKEGSLDALLDEDPAQTEALFSTGGRAEKEEQFDTAQDAARVRALIPRLPDSYRVVVTMRYLDDLSPKEIAATLGISENVVSVRLHRAVARLRAWYSERQ